MRTDTESLIQTIHNTFDDGSLSVCLRVLARETGMDDICIVVKEDNDSYRLDMAAFMNSDHDTVTQLSLARDAGGSVRHMEMSGRIKKIGFCAPLQFNHTEIGYIVYCADSPVDRHRYPFFEQISVHLGLSYIKVKLLTEYEEESIQNSIKLSALKEVADVINGLDLEVLLSKIMDLSLKLLSAQVGVIVLNDTAAGPEAGCEYGMTIEGLKEITVNGEALFEKVLYRGIPVVANKAGSVYQADIQCTRHVVDSLVSVPLPVKNAVIGSLTLVNSEKGFTENDLAIITTISGFAGTAIDNAVLHKEELEKERIEQQIVLARHIQQRFLPDRTPDSPCISTGALCVSCDETSGDYYDFIETEDGACSYVIGDVSGHGLGAALYMTTCRAFLHGLIKSGMSRVAVVEELNRMLARDMDDDKFMTFLIMHVEPDGNRFSYISAGHEAPLFYRKKTGKFDVLESKSLPLGIMGDTKYEESEPVIMEPGDMVFLCTDGIFEAMNSAGESYGIERLMECIRIHRSDEPQETLCLLYDDVVSFCSPEAIKDDVTVVLLKRKEEGH